MFLLTYRVCFEDQKYPHGYLLLGLTGMRSSIPIRRQSLLFKPEKNNDYRLRVERVETDDKTDEIFVHLSPEGVSVEALKKFGWKEIEY